MLPYFIAEEWYPLCKINFPAGLLLLLVELFGKSGGNEIKNRFWPAFIQFRHYNS